MTWTKIGSEFLLDPAILALPRGVRLVHLEALVWCNDHGTDGAVPRHMLGRLSDEPDVEHAAKLLVGAELWEITEDGWLIVGFLYNQPSAADVKRMREKWNERQRRQRLHTDHDHSLCDPKYCRVLRVQQAASRRDSPGESRDTVPTVPTEPSLRAFGSIERLRDGERGASGSTPQAASPPRRSPTARVAKGEPVGAGATTLPAAGSTRPCDLTVRTADARDEHIGITVEATDASADLLRRLANALRLEMADAKRLHKCPRAEGNRRECKIGMYGPGLSKPDPDADEPPGSPYVMFHVPTEYSQAWLDVIVWELTYGRASQVARSDRKEGDPNVMHDPS